MVLPVSQRCPRCGQWFMGSDCIGLPCLDCEYGIALPEHPPPLGREPDRSESGGSGDHILPSLHDFSAIDAHHRYESRSRAAFEKAHQLLDKWVY